MRRAGRDARSERGATAILATVLAVVLVGLSAYTVDFGRSYLSKRQLQNASDSGATAAASYYTDKPGTCAVINTPANQTAARALAVQIIQESRPGASLDFFDPHCVDGELVVTVSTVGSTNVALGGVYGASSITTQREAEATVEVATSAGRNLRPYAICSFDAPLANPTSPQVVKIEQPGQAHTPVNCPTANNPGNWWTVDCPEDNNNGNGTLAAATEFGCSSEISIVPNQPVNATPAVLSNFMIAACPNRSSSCLSANPGNDLHTPAVSDAWDAILGKTVLFPVFCGDDECNPAGVTDAGGNNTIYPVMKLASAVVCGYHWKNKNNQTSSGACANNPNNLLATQGNNQENYMLLVYTNIQLSGSTVNSTCPLGDPTCDGNARQVRLTK